jgi:putative ABC transport system permease protein
MKAFARIAALWRNLFRRKQVERELAEELDSYLALSAQAKERAGADPKDARREATLELGGVEQVKEEIRAVRLGHFIEMRWQDLSFAFRSLRHSPVFALTVTLVLALGIGSTALMFTIVNSLLIAGPPFPQPDRLFLVRQRIPNEDHVSFSVREFTAWKEQNTVFEQLGVYTGNGFTVSGRGEPEMVLGQMVTPSFFQILGARPILGRVFLESEGKVGQDREVILSEALWKRKFGRRSDVCGEQVVLNGEAYTIVGVMASAFDFPNHETPLWVPGDLRAPFFQDHPDAHFLWVIGRLKSGVSREQLEAEVALLGKRVDDPADKTDRHYFVNSLSEVLTGELRAPLLVLLGAVVLLLLIACANVVNLMLARGQARQSEMALRSALGASRSRLIAQLLSESGLLALIGGGFGFLLAIWGLELLQHFANLPELLQVHFNGSAFLFVALASAICALLFGLGPAISAARTELQDALTGAARLTTRATGPRHLLVFAEVALASVLLIGCALMLRSFVRLARVSPGFVAERVLTAEAVLSRNRYPGKPEMVKFYRESLNEIRNLPGVERAAVITHLPFGGNTWGNSFDIEGRPSRDSTDSAQIRPVSPGYFGALGIPLKSGRDFDERDNEKAPGVAIVNELLARRYWPDENPLGKKIRYYQDWLTIIGVCGDTKHAALDESPEGTIYVDYLQLPPGIMQFVARGLNFVVRSSRDLALGAEVRATLHHKDPDMVVKVNTMDALIHESIAQPRFRTWMVAIFAGFALALAALGIYGVIAYLVTQRYKEIGIRLALGATRGSILQLVLGRTLKLALAGTVAGLCAAFFLSRILTAILFGVTSHDPITYLVVPIGLILIALLAGYFPARRAMRVDPVRSLRYE